MYIHRYYSVTGVDLSLERVESSDARVRDILPAVLIRNRAVKRI
jgi:hypothetical protein